MLLGLQDTPEKILGPFRGSTPHKRKQQQQQVKQQLESNGPSQKAKGRRKKQNLNQHRATPDETAKNIRKPQKDQIPKSGTKKQNIIVAGDSMVKNLKGWLMPRKKNVTAVENLSHWVKDQLRPLANTCKYRLQDTNDVIFWLNSLNQKYTPFRPGMLLVSFDVVSMYPNLTLDHGIRAVRRKLLERNSISRMYY